MPALPPLIKPPALTSGATIGLVALSEWSPPEDVAAGKAVLKDAGYQVVIGDTNKILETPFAGTPQERADELHAFFADPAIDAIFCARGGYSAFKVVELLDLELIAAHSKIFIGFSDITHLLHAITAKTGLVTFHGPMLYTFRKGQELRSFEHVQGVLSGAVVATELSQYPGVKVLRPGTGSGPLWGGNLSILMSLMGTARQLQTGGRLLFIEDVHEPLHKLETMLQQLRASGLLSGITGLMVGEMTDIPEEPLPFGYGLREVILSACDGLDIPIIMGPPIGHGDTILTLPMGIPARLEAGPDRASLQFLDAPVT